MKSKEKVIKRVFFVMLMIVFAFVTLSGLMGGEKVLAVAKETLVVATPELPPTINSEAGLTAFGNQLYTALGESLLYYPYEKEPSQTNKDYKVIDYDPAELEYGLAERYEISQDGRTITFYLRKGVKNLYGNEFTAKDIIWKWEKGLRMGTLSEFTSGVLDFSGIEAFKVIDDYTFSLTADKPNPLLSVLHAIYTLTGVIDSTEAKKHETENDVDGMNYLSRNVPSYGPYHITEWVSGQQAVFEADPNYYKGIPEIKKVIIKVIPESSSRLAMIRDGSIDVALRLTPREIDSLKGTPGVRVITEKGLWFAHLIMNDLVVEPFKNKLVRQAVNFAIDRDKIIKMAYYGMAEPMMTTYQMQFPGALDSKEFPYQYDIEKAKKLMVEAGYPDGFSVDLYYETGVIPHETACVIIREDLSKIGINVTLRKTPIGTLYTLLNTAEASFVYWRESPFVADPYYATNLMYLNGPATGGTGWCNFTGFNNAEVNKMIMDGKTITDKNERYNHYYELQRLILELAPIGFVVQEGYLVAINDKIEGWNINIGEGCRFSELKFRE